MSASFNVQHVAPDCLGAILALSDRGLGAGYLGADDFSRLGTAGWMAVTGGQVVGFSLAEVVSYGSLLHTYPTLSGRIASLESLTETVGIFRSILVEPSERGRGVASALMRPALDWLAARSVVVVMFGWKRDGQVSVHGLARKFKFREIALIEGLWSASSIRENYSCPVCGRPPCRCEGLLYVLDRDALVRGREIGERAASIGATDQA